MNSHRSRPSRAISQSTPQPPSTPPTPSPNLIPIDERRRIHHLSRLPLLLFRHKELLKKLIIKKRCLLEKELGVEIQV